MTLNKIGVVVLIAGMAFFTSVSLSCAKQKVSTELADAQALLAKGEYEKAFKEYQYFATEKQNPLAQFTMGLFFRLGWGRPVDDKRACEWFEKAGKNGIPTATHFFADCLRGGTGAQQDPARAAEWYKKAADLGYHISLCSLAELYMTGTGVPKDPEKALKLCGEAAEKRVIPAQIRMGRFYLEETLIRDYTKAYDWFSRAADLEVPEAQYYIGVMLKDGLGRPKDQPAARMWFEKAAEKGYTKAYLQVGYLYFTGPRNPETGLLPAAFLAKSYMWLSAAIRQKENFSNTQMAESLMKKVLKEMPETWKKDLDSKVEDHFRSFPASPSK